MGTNFSAYPSLPGQSVDVLVSNKSLKFDDTDKDSANLKLFFDTFKERTGKDIMSLKGGDFGQVTKGLLFGTGVIRQYNVPPTKEIFYHNLKRTNRELTQQNSDMVYNYFFYKKDENASAASKGEPTEDNKTVSDALFSDKATKDTKGDNTNKGTGGGEARKGAPSAPPAASGVTSSSLTDGASSFNPLPTAAASANPVSTLSSAPSIPSAATGSDFSSTNVMSSIPAPTA
jgi:hypothetical protein